MASDQANFKPTLEQEIKMARGAQNSNPWKDYGTCAPGQYKPSDAPMPITLHPDEDEWHDGDDYLLPGIVIVVVIVLVFLGFARWMGVV
jgi:hypothetical protein